MKKRYDTVQERDAAEGEGGDNEGLTHCSTCRMPLPMCQGQPLPLACLKCYPNGPVKQKGKKKQKKDMDACADDDAPKKKKGGDDDEDDTAQGYGDDDDDLDGGHDDDDDTDDSDSEE